MQKLDWKENFKRTLHQMKIIQLMVIYEKKDFKKTQFLLLTMKTAAKKFHECGKNFHNQEI